MKKKLGNTGNERIICRGQTLTLAVKPEAVKQQGIVKRMCKCIKIGKNYQ